MFNAGQDKIGRQLNCIFEGEKLRYHPVIQSTAGDLALQFVGIELDEETAACAAIAMADDLANLRDATGLSIDVIQSALIAAEPRLAESQEGYFHTY